MTTMSDRPSVVGGNRKWNPAMSPNWSRARKTASMTSLLDSPKISAAVPGAGASAPEI